MGFLQPSHPDLDLPAWRRGTRQERMKPLVRHFCEVGFGSPDAVTLVYVLKIALYLLVGWLFVLSTPGIDGFTEVGRWWDSPAVFYKFVLWTMLFEVLGLGCGFGPLNLRMTPPLGSFLYWLRPGTIRLAPWGTRVPLTGGDTRAVVDVVLYAALLVSLAVAAWGALPRWQVLVVLVVLAMVGLRDKVIFLAARSEVYGTLAVTYLFINSGVDAFVAAQLVMVAIWWGAATSKVNRHFPFVVAAMESNSPVWRSKRIKRRFHRDFPDDLRPSGLSRALAHGGTVFEYVVPLLLLLGDGGVVTNVAAVGMLLFHFHILSSLPMGVPLEWNVFMMIGIVNLFVGGAGVGVTDLTDPVPVVLLMTVVAAVVLLGNLRPDLVSFLPAMRYYAGNWDTSMWCFRGDALDKMDAHLVKASLMPHQQLEKMYGDEDVVAMTMNLGYAFRGMHTHGRALFALVERACGPEHEDYLVIDGEMVAGTALGWNFGDGHLHDERLVAALQRRCHFEPGEVRVVMLEAQPFHKTTQRYRLVDAATGELERGYVEVADMVSRQPTDLDIPVHVTS
ncbi:DUF3556 domain-containing protein [Nocardioides sp.]|uniref:DUF3556 domain-containing protein n=1 Tax=Nocardioides sp. TaxID=35761 RepID=UPI001A30CC9D|nr:DUF3556 domain-containing protein [Nocardioides sp.]MBJ7358248.1 DUF3556 domain-containing protein [Nocardioides sp.]